MSGGNLEHKRQIFLEICQYFESQQLSFHIMNCDFCPHQTSKKAIKLCCPQGQAACEKCLYSIINAAFPCGNCEMKLGKKISKLKAQFIEMGSNRNEDPLEQSKLKRMGSSGNLGNFHRMNMGPMPHVYQMNQNRGWSQNYHTPYHKSEYYGCPTTPDKNWAYSPQFYQSNLEREFQLFQQYCQMRNQNSNRNFQNFPQQFNPNQALYQHYPSPNMGRCDEDGDITGFRKQALAKLMRSASRSIIPEDVMQVNSYNQQEPKSIKIGNFSIQGSYVNSRTTDNVPTNTNKRGPLSKSSSMNNFFTRKQN